MSEPVISTVNALILGIVEGITEFLPVSSTGHLVITSDLLGLRNLANFSPDEIEAIQAFEIVIQGGAILAVLLVYRRYFIDTIRGVLGKSPAGRRLFINIVTATVPVLGAGFLLKGVISRYLQFTTPVLAALVLGGIAMLFFERIQSRKAPESSAGLVVHDLTPRQALIIGAVQCLALWPGTSRSMVTIIGGMVVGLSRPAAAEFSFLIAFPALLAATAYKALKSGDVLITHVGSTALAVGFLTSTMFAGLAVRWLISYLNARGLSVFGWYRLALATVIFFVVT